MRAREPDRADVVERDGVRLAYEVFGEGKALTLLLLPTWSLVHSRQWKMQVPDLARRYRVVTFDGRGNGGSSRPKGAEAYTPSAFAEDAHAVLDAVGGGKAVLVGFSAGARYALEFARRFPERLAGMALIAPAVALGEGIAGQEAIAFDERFDAPVEWQQYNRHHWLEHYDDFVEWFIATCLSESHSTKPIEDFLGWARETTGEVLADTVITRQDLREREPVLTPDGVRRVARELRCPVLVIQGEDDRIVHASAGMELAQLADARLVLLSGAGHVPHARHPVRVQLELRAFLNGIAGAPPPATRWHRALSRPRRALYVSSPIGLGHVQRDLAIARELRALVPGLEIDWWAQHPVTRVLETACERIHPDSRAMASESRHWELESAHHELHAFYAFRRMDEIFLANFLLFHDVATREHYDLWIGDESWEVDYHLHENPELKAAPYAFLTDVIGFLPVNADADPREAEIVADYNAEMIEQRARYPRLRDLSLYVGDLGDLPDVPFGPGLPTIPSWSRRWFEPVGTILPTGVRGAPTTEARRRRRGRLGYPETGPLLFAAVGGTSIGLALLRLVAQAFALYHGRHRDARMVMVTGPRIDPSNMPDLPGLEVRGYVHDLHAHMACADLAIVQGGLSSTMELVGAGVPFLYFPLRKHWEQVHHVQRRLERYGAGRGLDFATTTPEELAARMERALEDPPAYRRVRGGGARRAAHRIAQLLQR